MNLVKIDTIYAPMTNIGTPVGLGYLYVGDPDTDPEVVANQKTIYMVNEDGTQTALSQPVRLGAGGVPLNNGSPIVIVTDGDYSLKILDSNESQIYYTPFRVNEETYMFSVNSLSELQNITIHGTEEISVYVSGRTAKNDGYQGIFYWDSSDLSTEVSSDTYYGIYAPPASDTSGASGAWVRQISDGRVLAEFYGAAPDDITVDSTAYIQSAIDNNGHVYLTQGIYYSDSTILLGTTENLFLESGSRIYRSSTRTAGTSPLVTLTGNHANLIGDSKLCQIYSENSIPTGIVRVDASGANSQQNVIENLGIGGGSNSRAIYITDDGTYTAHYGRVSGIRIFDVDTGVRQENDVNAWVFSDIQFGNIATRAIDYNNTAENSWHGVFVTGSSGITECLKLANVSYANHFYGFITEPGGGAWINIDATSLQNVIVGENVSGGAITNLGAENFIIESGRVRASAGNIVTGTNGSFTTTGDSTKIGISSSDLADISEILAIQTAYNPPSLADGASDVNSFSVSGIQPGDPAFVSLTSLTSSNWDLVGHCVSAGTLRVRLTNRTGGTVDLPAGILNAVVFRLN